MIDSYKERLLQCPYCTHYKTVSGTRVPKSIGKYRIKIIYNNMLILKCSRCTKISRYTLNSDLIQWEKLSYYEQMKFKKSQYKKYKGGNKK